MYDADLQNIGGTVQELGCWAIIVMHGIQMNTYDGTTGAHE